MHAIKTALSIQKTIFDQMEQLAKEWKVSRSEIFLRAAKEFLERQRNIRILSGLNRVYQKDPSLRERRNQKTVLKYSRKVIDSW